MRPVEIQVHTNVGRKHAENPFRCISGFYGRIEEKRGKNRKMMVCGYLVDMDCISEFIEKSSKPFVEFISITFETMNADVLEILHLCQNFIPEINLNIYFNDSIHSYHTTIDEKNHWHTMHPLHKIFLETVIP